jgi:hypothetical protein
MVDDEYLGDGVYASFDGYHLLLDLRAQPESSGHVCRIAMEPSVLKRLDEYRALVEKERGAKP